MKVHLQGSLDYVPGRVYVKEHVGKGKSRKGSVYKRESRNGDRVIESMPQILKFIKDQNKELLNFIQETTEREVYVGTQNLLKENSFALQPVYQPREVDAEDSEIDSDEEMLEIDEFEI